MNDWVRKMGVDSKENKMPIPPEHFPLLGTCCQVYLASKGLFLPARRSPRGDSFSALLVASRQDGRREHEKKGNLQSIQGTRRPSQAPALDPLLSREVSFSLFCPLNKTFCFCLGISWVFYLQHQGNKDQILIFKTGFMIRKNVISKIDKDPAVEDANEEFE